MVQQQEMKQFHNLDKGNLPTSIHPVQMEMWSNENVCKRYENFASHEPYVSGIDTLLTILGDLSYDDILELGCGVGSATEKIVSARSIIATDISSATIQHCKHKLTDNHHINFKEEEAIRAILDYGVNSNLIIAVNCIHLFEELPSVLRSAYQVLHDSGRIAFSTTLTVDATPEEEGMNFAKAVLEMRKQARKERKSKITRREPHPPLRRREDYRVLCEDAGFQICDWNVQRVKQTLPMIRDFFLLPGVIEDLAKVKIDESKREALANVAIDKLREFGLDGIQRDWLHVVAEKC